MSQFMPQCVRYPGRWITGARPWNGYSSLQNQGTHHRIA